MRVVHINEHLARKGGVETYLLALLPLLEARGVESAWMFGRGDASLWPDAHPVEGMGAVSFGAEARVRARVAEGLEVLRPDVIHVHNVQNVGVLEAAFAHGPTVMTAHDYRGACPANTFFFRRTRTLCSRHGAGLGCLPLTLAKHCVTPNPRYGGYYYHRARWMMDHADRFETVIAPSGGAAERYRRAGYPAGRLKVLPYFCPVEPLGRPRPLPSNPTLTYMGRVAANKGTETFVEALGRLPADVRGLMVGNFGGEVGEAVRARAARAGCADRLTLRPWASREEVQAILDETSVFVFPSLWPETLGIVGLEALARGVPVVASDVGGVREWLRDGETGRLVPPGDARALADAAGALLASPETVRRYGQNGINLIRARFLPEQHADRLVALYREAGHA